VPIIHTVFLGLTALALIVASLGTVQMAQDSARAFQNAGSVGRAHRRFRWFRCSRARAYIGLRWPARLIS
jgi:hypothetical protein